jgi:Tfp pilus assembly protein PilF
MKNKAQEGALLAQLAAYGKNPGKKIELCLAQLINDPNNVRIRLALADAFGENKSIDGAIIEARMAAEIDPKNFDALKAMGMFMAQRGRPDDINAAQQALDQATKMKPEDRDCARELRNLAARATIAKTGLESAKDDYRKALKDTKKADELERAGQQIKSDEQFEAEVARVKREMARDPKDFRFARKLGDLYFDIKKDFDVAAEWFKKAGELNTQDSTLRDKVDDCAFRKLDAAIAAAKAAGDPKLKELQVEKIKVEIASFERRTKDRPTDPGPKLELGRRLLQTGQFDKAIQQLQQSVKDPKLKVDSLILLGQAFQKKSMYDLADDNFAKAETAGFVPPEKMRAIRYERARCKAESGNLDGAIELGKVIMSEDIGYKDISELVTQWTQKKAQKN